MSHGLPGYVGHMPTLRSTALLDRAIPETTGRSEPRSRRTRRDPWSDNAKMTLVTLVVVGHAWTLLPHSTGNDWAYDFLYAWHIPAFVLITGYLSRSFTWSRAQLVRLVRTVAVPYLVFEAALAVFRYQVGGVELHDLFLDPHWPMWYLSALFFWRLSTPVFTALPRAAALSAAVVISLLAGLWAGDTLDIARILGLLPFFVLGLHLHDVDWDRLRPARTAWFGALGLAAVLVLTRFTDSWIATEWYYYRSRYDALQPDDLRAMTTRFVLLGIGLLGAVSFFALVPRTRSWLTALGPATLTVYLFHGFVVLGAQYAGFPAWAADHTTLAVPVVLVGAVTLAVLLAAPPVARRLQPLVDPLAPKRVVRSK